MQVLWEIKSVMWVMGGENFEKSFWKIQERKRKRRDKVIDVENQTDSPYSDCWCWWLQRSVIWHQLPPRAMERLGVRIRRWVTTFWTLSWKRGPHLGIAWETQGITRMKGDGEVNKNPNREKGNKNQVDFRLVLCNRESMSMEAVGRLESWEFCFVLFWIQVFSQPLYHSSPGEFCK